MGNNAHGFLLAKGQIGGKMSCDIRRSALLTWILIVICMIVFCGSAAYLLLYGQNKISAEKEFNQMRKSFRDLSGLYAQNSDLVGWIRVDGTRIDYPVMQTPDNPEYYLHRDFNKEYSDSGTPFLDANSRIGGTWNWIIYGHNMKFGTMFHDLQKYDSKEFWDAHKTFSVDVYDPETGIIDPEVYEIFAVCSASKGSLKPKYMYGVILVSTVGWVLGTFLGAAAGEILPSSVTAALGIVLYGMFIAIIIPPSRKEKSVLFVVLTAAALSCICKYFIPTISGGFAVILCALISSLMGAIFFPKTYDKEDENK